MLGFPGNYMYRYLHSKCVALAFHPTNFGFTLLKTPTMRKSKRGGQVSWSYSNEGRHFLP